MLQTTFNPGLTLTGFRTTRPWSDSKLDVQQDSEIWHELQKFCSGEEYNILPLRPGVPDFPGIPGVPGTPEIPGVPGFPRGPGGPIGPSLPSRPSRPESF